MSSIPNIKSEIMRVIRKFKFEELETCVLPHFPEVSWKTLKSVLVREHASFTTNQALKLILHKINKDKISNAQLVDRLMTLEATEVSKHSSKRTWYCHAMKDKKGEVDMESIDEIEERITDSLNANNFHMKVRAVVNNEIVFLCIREINNKKRRRVLPIYIGVTVQENYLFSSNKSFSMLKPIAEGLCYTNVKYVKLVGKDIFSLLRLRHARSEGQENDQVDFVHGAPMKRQCGVDFCQLEARRAHAKTYLGNEPPKFEQLKIRKDEQTWNFPNKNLVTDDKFAFRWEFHSHNVPKLLKTLIEKRIIVTPAPKYVANLISIGRTEFNLNILEG